MKNMCGKELEKKYVLEQKKHGEKMGEVTLGQEVLVHSYFFRTRYIRYQDIKKAGIRIVNNQSGDLGIDEYSLVLLDREDKEHVLHVDYRQYADEAVKHINKKKQNIGNGENSCI